MVSGKVVGWSPSSSEDHNNCKEVGPGRVAFCLGGTAVVSTVASKRQLDSSPGGEDELDGEKRREGQKCQRFLLRPLDW